MSVQQKPLIIGYHARKAGFKTYEDAYRHASQLIIDELPDSIPCPALFVAGPRSTHLNIDAIAAESLGEIVTNIGGALLFHASYLDLPWSAMTIEDSVFERIDLVVESCAHARADVVIHCGSHIFDRARSSQVLHRLARSIERAVARARPQRVPRIFIETMPYDARFESVGAINSIFDSIRTQDALSRHPLLMNIGLCVDTAHIWAAGANITTRESCAEWFGSLRDDIPVAIHLNDSKEIIGSLHDIHTTLGNGEIWSLTDGYMAIIEWAREHESPMILERNDKPETEARADLATIRRKLN